MNRNPLHYSYNQGAGYQLGPQVNAFLDQPIPLREDPYNSYGARYMQQQRAKQNQVLRENVPELDDEEEYAIEDIGSSTITNIQKGHEQEPIFRVYNIVANSKYAANNLSGGNRLQWNLGPILSAQTSGSIQVDEQLLNNIIEVSVQPFEIPAGLFNSSDTFYGPVGLFLNCFSAPSLSITDYVGQPSSSNVLRYHFSIRLSPGSRPGRVLCTPVNDTYKFPMPTRVQQSIWELSFVSPLRPTIPLPLAIYTGDLVGGSNPMVINATTGMVTGDEITIESAIEGYNSADILSVTVLTPGSFSVPLSALTLASRKVQFVIMTRVIRAEFRVVALDTIGSLITSSRSIHLA